MKLFGSFLFIIFLTNNLYAQAPAIVWQKTYGGSLNDIGYSICRSHDGGYIIACESNSSDGDVTTNIGNEDIWLIKIDSLGNLEWEKSLGGTLHDYPNTIFQKLDNGYVFFGTTDSKNGDVIGLHQNVATHQYGLDGWLVKIDSIGDIEWQRCLGGIDRDIGMDLCLTSDNYFLITEEVWSNDGDVSNLHGQADYWLAKLDASGNLLWGNTYGGSVIDGPTRSIELSNGTYIIAGGSAYNFGGYHGTPGLGGDIGILNVDTSGNILWSKCFGGTDLEGPMSLIPGNNGNFYMVSENSSSNGDITDTFYGGTDFWITKINHSGSIIWDRSYGGSSIDSPNQMLRTSDGGFILTGRTASSDNWVTGYKGFFDVWVVKIDSLGNFEWQKCLGGTNWDESFSIVESSDHGVVICGFTESIDGDVTSNHGGKDVWVVKLAPQGVSVPEQQNIIINLNINQINDDLCLNFVSKKNANMQLQLYDISGKIICEKNIIINQGSNIQKISCNNLTSGMYYVNLGGILQKKIFIN